jgi:hypothetical protein
MSEMIICDEAWTHLTEVEKTEVVRRGGATLRQLTQGLLDGPDELRSACHDFLIHTSTGLEELPITSSERWVIRQTNSVNQPPKKVAQIHRPTRSKSGLPKDFIRLQRRQIRSRLLPENIYRLPDGREFVPVVPSGALGSLTHQYALLTRIQYQENQRGSVYVRTDGRIFDYSSAETDSTQEFFDTGFTMADLQRTGCYAKPAVMKQPHNGKNTKRQKSKASNA